MKITIDTKEDSSEEIRKAIQFLSSFLDEQYPARQPNIFENPAGFTAPAGSGDGPPMNAFGAMFGENTPLQSSASENQPKPKIFPIEDEIPRIVPY
ncbi:hypothetical protein HYU14_01840 [Candidatus Woesearchaeota archaeon]|nr:hypothetical protein [Candidatus Woesearchaeota archaeon]